MTKCPMCKTAELVPITGSDRFYRCAEGCPGVYEKMKLRRPAA